METKYTVVTSKKEAPKIAVITLNLTAALVMELSPAVMEILCELKIVKHNNTCYLIVEEPTKEMTSLNNGMGFYVAANSGTAATASGLNNDNTLPSSPPLST